jgi:hypothetical protein
MAPDAAKAAGGGPADEFFTALGADWQLTAAQQARLAPAVAAALDAGWAPRALAAVAGANTSGVRNPYAVLAARLSPAELPPPHTRRPSRPPWCGECDERTRRGERDDGADAGRCPACHPLAAKKKLAAAVKASGTTMTSVFGVGPVIAATVIGDVVTVARFPTRDHFAAYNGTAPVEVSSGEKKIYRLSLRGNRRLNHAIHMAAITQISHAHSDGRAYYDRKTAEGKTHKEALRCLKRRISNAIYARLRADARAAGLGGQPGNPAAGN